MRPYVSVIIPAYNSAAFLPAAIASVRAQAWEELEIVVVDDGSTDHTMSVLGALAGSDLRVFRQANSGPSAARNRGIKESQGEWIAFLDADCYWLPGKLDAQFSAVGSNPEPAGFSYTGSLLVDEGGQTIATRPAVPRECLVEDLVWGNLISTSSAIARREALLAAGMFDETLRIGEDWDLWLRLSADFEGRCVPEPLMAERASCWDGKYQMRIYEAATLKIVPRFFDSLQGNQKLTLLAQRKQCALSWHLSVLAKSYLRRRQVASFARLAAKSVIAHPQGIGFLLSGRRPAHV
jgi:glycosyltransferase involved in cell wall biosynthesis